MHNNNFVIKDVLAMIIKSLTKIGLLLFVLPAVAFQINPTNRNSSWDGEYEDFEDEIQAQGITEPVHEFIVREARDLYMDKCRSGLMSKDGCKAINVPEKVINDSIIRGVWWSDDPNQLLYKLRQSVWVGYMLDGKRRANDSRYTIDGKYMLHYRSHFGDMQFMHAMASADNELPEVTKANIMMWGEFLFGIATGKYNRKMAFKDIDIAGIRDLFGAKSNSPHSNTELRYMITPRYFLGSDPDKDFRLHALGALMHMVHDSYSSSHVQRIASTDGVCKHTQINRFLSYAQQSSSKHGSEDTWETFKNKQYADGDGPIAVSAELIWHVNNNSDWNNVVAPYLSDVVFCVADAAEKSGPGDYID